MTPAPGLKEPAESGAIQATVVQEPKQRIFLPQSMRERIAAVAWNVLWHVLFRWSPLSMNVWRVLLLRMFGARIGRRCFISPSVRVDFPWNLRMGERVFVAHDVILNCMGEIHLGDRVLISQYSHLCAGTHEYQRRDMQITRTPIRIGDDVWIAADAFVGPGVTIGNGSLLAARSSAFEDLPPAMVCIGEPARPRHPRPVKA